MIISKDRLFNIKDKIKVYREGGIDGKFVITEDEIDWLINEVERLRLKKMTYANLVNEHTDEITRLNQEIEKLRKELEDSRNTNEMLMRCDFVGCENPATGGTPQRNGLYYSTCKEHHHLAECGF